MRLSFGGLLVCCTIIVWPGEYDRVKKARPWAGMRTTTFVLAVLIHFAKGRSRSTQLHNALRVQLRRVRPCNSCNHIGLTNTCAHTRCEFPARALDSEERHADFRKRETETCSGEGLSLENLIWTLLPNPSISTRLADCLPVSMRSCTASQCRRCLHRTLVFRMLSKS